MYHWYEAHKTYFSTEGERGLIYLKRTNYTQQLPGIETLVTRLQAETGLIKHIDAWPVKFKVIIETRPTQLLKHSACCVFRVSNIRWSYVVTTQLSLYVARQCWARRTQHRQQQFFGALEKKEILVFLTF